MEPFLYLRRIGYSGPIKPDAQTLRGLHLAHMFSVPFENLDIGLGRPIRLSEEALWEKIVVQRRGGFCYELNGLFAWLLTQLDFDVTYLNARVYNRQGQLGIDFDHLALLVQIPHQSGRWLVDVGFGDSFNEPLDFEERMSRVRDYAPTVWKRCRMDLSPGKRTTTGHGNDITTLICYPTSSQKNMKRPVCIIKLLPSRVLRGGVSSAGRHPKVASH